MKFAPALAAVALASPVLSQNQVWITQFGTVRLQTADDVAPDGSGGVFETSRDQGFVPGVNGTSNGNLCLGGAIGGYSLPTQILSSGSGGTFSLGIDLTAVPEGATPVPVLAGEARNFLAWHRDPAGPGSNFTDGLEIVFH